MFTQENNPKLEGLFLIGCLQKRESECLAAQLLVLRDFWSFELAEEKGFAVSKLSTTQKTTYTQTYTDR